MSLVSLDEAAEGGCGSFEVAVVDVAESWPSGIWVTDFKSESGKKKKTITNFRRAENLMTSQTGVSSRNQSFEVATVPARLCPRWNWLKILSLLPSPTVERGDHSDLHFLTLKLSWNGAEFLLMNKFGPLSQPRIDRLVQQRAGDTNTRSRSARS